MFGIWPRRRTNLIDHWYVLLPDFQASTTEFYRSVEEELVKKLVPDMELSKVEFPEGNVLSARRIYLRMRRERLVFDVCSAPFGTAWFFSCRFAEIPLLLRVWELVAILGTGFGVFWIYAGVFGFLWGSIVFGISAISILYLLSSIVPMGLYSLDAKLIKVPVLGALYEIFVRRNTFYREDTRLMYCDLVNRIVRQKVADFAGVEDVSKVEFKSDPFPGYTGHRRLLWEQLMSLWPGLPKN